LGLDSTHLCFKNALKLTYAHLLFQKVSGVIPWTPVKRARKGKRGEGNEVRRGEGTERRLAIEQ
jgi:hypothetical protein